VAIATKASGTATLLPSPAILDDEAVKDAIVSDRTVASVLSSAKSADTYLFSAGAVDTNSVLVESGYLSTEEIKDLVSKGAVCDVIGRFVDADGNIIDPALDRRSVGIEIGDLRRAKRAIAVIAGPAKHDVCRAVVTAGLCSVIITDEVTARHLLGVSDG
jgi:deoxyribonucleoside regulator